VGLVGKFPTAVSQIFCNGENATEIGTSTFFFLTVISAHTNFCKNTINDNLNDHDAKTLKVSAVNRYFCIVYFLTLGFLWFQRQF
jgi:hypothetical protein